MRWTEEEDRAVLEGDQGYGSAHAVATKLGRSVTSVYARRQILIGKSKARSRAIGKEMPRWRTSWLIAKSCLECGELLSAAEFSPRADGGRESYCIACRSARVSTRRATDGGHFDAVAAQRQRRVQGETLETARNHRKEWTGPELEIVMRDDLTDRQKAEALGRSFWAVRHMITRMRRGDPVKTRVSRDCRTHENS